MKPGLKILDNKIYETFAMAEAATTYKLIQTRAEAKAEIKMLSTEAVLYFDCEVVHVGRPYLSLVQACGGTGPVRIFDCATDTTLVSRSGMLELLEDGEITKVMHDCRLECSTFFNLFGVEIENIFDTQVAYRALDAKAHTTTMSHTKMASFADVCSSLGVTFDLSLKQDLKYEMDMNPFFWATRPLTDDMETYAAKDVTALVSIYPILKARLAGSGYEAFFHNMCDEYRYTPINPTRAKQLRKMRERLELLDILKVKPNYPLSKAQRKMLNAF